MSLKQFIDSNRQQGSTTALVKTCIAENGYLIVGSLSIKREIIEKFAHLNPSHVFTIQDIKNGKCIGLKSRALFFDISAIES